MEHTSRVDDSENTGLGIWLVRSWGASRGTEKLVQRLLSTRARVGSLANANTTIQLGSPGTEWQRSGRRRKRALRADAYLQEACGKVAGGR